jgi:hypothetical protein
MQAADPLLIGGCQMDGVVGHGGSLHSVKRRSFACGQAAAPPPGLTPSRHFMTELDDDAFTSPRRLERTTHPPQLCALHAAGGASGRR